MIGLQFCPRRTLAMPVLFALLALQGCERAKTKLDREVDRLCAIDGGVHVYETVKLPKENFGPDGEVFPQYRGRPMGNGRFGPDYLMRSDERIVVPGNPSLYRFTTAIVRRSDNRVMGQTVSYVRRGGDLMFGPWPDSSYSCGNGLPSSPAIEKQVFIKEGEA